MKFSTIVPAYDPSWTPEKVWGLNLIGHRYGRLWVIREAGRVKRRAKTWLCSCSCGSGELKVVYGSGLRSGNTRSCGCILAETLAALKGKRRDRSSLVDRKFGRLTVTKDSGKRMPSGNIIYTCACECGNTTDVCASNLKASTTSCGCLLLEKITTHGLAGHYLYQVWVSMVHRCHNPSSTAYPNYGGRGIRVHAPWRDEPAAFLDWIDGTLGVRPEGHSLDRIDNDGNYEPDNLRWADGGTQNSNRRCSLKNKKV